jgi:hypothetical protein
LSANADKILKDCCKYGNLPGWRRTQAGVTPDNVARIRHPSPESKPGIRLRHNSTRNRDES